MFDVVNDNIGEAAASSLEPRVRDDAAALQHRSGVREVTCPAEPPDQVDGPSHQSEVTQDLFELITQYCGTTDYWIISGDTGIHPNIAGHAQFAQALAQVVQANNLLPPLPSQLSGRYGPVPSRSTFS